MKFLLKEGKQLYFDQQMATFLCIPVRIGWYHANVYYLLCQNRGLVLCVQLRRFLAQFTSDTIQLQLLTVSFKNWNSIYVNIPQPVLIS